MLQKTRCFSEGCNKMYQINMYLLFSQCYAGSPQLRYQVKLAINSITDVLVLTVSHLPTATSWESSKCGTMHWQWQRTCWRARWHYRWCDWPSCSRFSIKRKRKQRTCGTLLATVNIFSFLMETCGQYSLIDPYMHSDKELYFQPYPAVPYILMPHYIATHMGEMVCQSTSVDAGPDWRKGYDAMPGLRCETAFCSAKAALLRE